MLSKKARKAKETAESSAGTGALFKEELPKKVIVGDVWEKNNLFPPQKGRQLEAASETETAAEADSLMGRLAKRMASRDMIDELNLGPKGSPKGVKEAQVADNNQSYTKKGAFADYLDEVPSKLLVGAGRHEQTTDLTSNNTSDPIQTTMQNPGSTMRDQALNLAKGEAKLKGGDIPDHNFNNVELRKGTEIEKEHTNNHKLAKQIAKGHLIEDPNYYFKLKKTGL